MQKIIALLVVTVFALQAMANGDTVIVRKDPRLDILSAKQAQINRRSSMMTSSGLYRGYRVQVLSTQSRGEAFKMKTDLLTKFPELKTYLLFQSPNFKVRIGNYIKREDAEKLRKQLSKLITTNIYVVEDAVEYALKDDLMNEVEPQ
jgi:SPOR domain